MSLSYTKEIFANRFEPHGDGFLFRANLRAPGYRISKEERDSFVADFNWRILVAVCLGAVFVVLSTIGMLFALPSISYMSPDFATALIMAIFLLLFLPGYLWLWNAPVRAMRGNTPAVEARTKAEARRLGFKKITWAQFGMALAVVAVMLIRVGYQHNLLIGWNRLWLVLAAAFLLLLAVQAFRKWRFDHTGE